MLRSLVYLLSFLILGQTAHADSPALSFDSSLFETARLPFIPHEDRLSVNISAPALGRLKKTLEDAIDEGLDAPPSAELNVVSAVEMAVLKTRLRGADIDELARNSMIQSVLISPLCLARTSRESEGMRIESYEVRVEADGLRALRWGIQRLFIKRGGEGKQFEPAAYRPSITVALRPRLLGRGTHEEEGCLFALEPRLLF